MKSLTSLLYAVLPLVMAGITACSSEPALPAESASLPYRGTDNLLTVGAVDSLMAADADIFLIELSKEDRYREEGHLPGAHRLWRDDYGSIGQFPYGGMRASRKALAERLGRLGVRTGQEIVLYDDKGNVNALRLWWLLRMYGHKRVRIMDGGKKAWQLAGLALEKTPVRAPAPTGFHFTGPAQSESLAHLDDLILALKDTNVIILDTREPEEYHGHPMVASGEVQGWKQGAYTYGRIPGAVHLNWSDAVDLHNDHRFKPTEVIRYNFRQAGIRPEKEILVYCQSGVRSAHTTFVLRELLGFPRVRNYDGSWIEWSYHHTRDGIVPVEQELQPEAHRAQAELLAAEMDIQ